MTIEVDCETASISADQTDTEAQSREELELVVSDTARLTQDGKATSDSLPSVRPHAEVGVNVYSQVTHRRRRNDSIGHNPACRPPAVADTVNGQAHQRSCVSVMTNDERSPLTWSITNSGFVAQRNVVLK